MQKVYAIGESLIDIIFSGSDVKAAKAGGSMLNGAVSLGRAGVDVIFLSEFGNDHAGNFILDFLEKNHVKTHLIHRYNDGKTPMALAFLNEKGDASYDFYKIYPPGRLMVPPPPFTASDIFLFGSFFGIDPAIREPLMNIARGASQAGTLIVYDPNFRKPHAYELDRLHPVILENMKVAHIIKASNEDMEIIFGTSDLNELRKIPELQNKPLILTLGAKGAIVDTGSWSQQFQGRPIEVVSTIGAGDNFNAGLIYGLIREGVTASALPSVAPETWQSIVHWAIEFAAQVCMSYENYIPVEYGEKLQ